MTEHDRIEAYLDGQLTGSELEAFERAIEQAPELRAQIALQHKIDASLRRTLVLPTIAPPRGPAAGASGGDVEPSPRAGRWSLGRWAAVAAGVVLVAGIAGYVLLLAPQRAPWDQPTQVYARVVDHGFEPRVVCTTPEAFSAWMVDHFDQPMVIETDADPAGGSGADESIELVGWDYARVFDRKPPRTGVLLARVGGDEVIVLVDRKSRALRLRAPADSGLHLFRRTVGNVVLYEVTPRDEAVLIERARAGK